MGVGGSCRRNKDGTIDPNIQGFDAGTAESYGPNEIREISITDKFSVLVSQVDGKFFAYGSKCPHYGAPLAKGALQDGMVKCPWHGACFDIKTGDIEDHPGLHSIPTYQVIEDKAGLLKVYPTSYGEYKLQKPLSQTKDRSKLTVILGGGAAGFSAALTLRENSYEGRILIISNDACMPYDRTKLSKTPGCIWEDVKLVDEKWYTEAQIEVQLNAEVENCKITNKKIFIKDQNDPIVFDQLLIATGCRPRLPSATGSGGVEGADLKNVMKLYNLKDGARIKEECAGKDVVIIGSGFIAMELAASLPTQSKSINIIARSKLPYGIALGGAVGKVMLQHVLAKSNVKYQESDGVKRIVANDDGAVKEVITLKDNVYPCDVVIFAIGAEPNTGMFNAESDPELPNNFLHSSGYIPVNEYMQTTIENVYAAGDCARIPLNCSVSKWASIGHWGMAQKMGRIAALNMLGMKQTISNTIPFFWHNVSGLNIRYAGFGEQYNETLIFGNLEEKKFCVLYRKDGKVLACCTCNCDPIAARMSFDMQDEIEWDGFPSYITDVFPSPPKTDIEITK